MKVCKYECLLRHNSYNNANFTKTIRHITHVDVLFLLTLILKTLCRPAYIASVCYCFDSVAKENRLKIKNDLRHLAT